MGHEGSVSDEDKWKEAKLGRQIRANHGERAVLAMPGPMATVTEILVHTTVPP